MTKALKKRKLMKASLKFKKGVVRDILISDINGQKLASPLVVSAPNCHPQVVATDSFVEYTLLRANVRLYVGEAYDFIQPPIEFHMEDIADSYELLAVRYRLKVVARLKRFTIALAENGHFVVVEQIRDDYSQVRFAFSPIAVSDEAFRGMLIHAYEHPSNAEEGWFDYKARINFRNESILTLSAFIQNNAIVFHGGGNGFLYPDTN